MSISKNTKIAILEHFLLVRAYTLAKRFTGQPMQEAVYCIKQSFKEDTILRNFIFEISTDAVFSIIKINLVELI